MRAGARERLFRTDDTLASQAGRRAGNASVLLLIFSAVKILIQVGAIVVLARLVPPSDYGVAALAMPVVAITTSISQFGLAQAFIQSKTVTHDFASALFWVNCAFGLFFSAVVAALGGPAAEFYGQPLVEPVFWVLAISNLSGALCTQYAAILQRNMHIRTLEASNILAMVGATSIAIVAATQGAGYWAIVLQYMMAPTLLFLLFVVTTGWLPSLPNMAALKAAKEAMGFGGHIAIYSLIVGVSDNLGTIFAGRVFSETVAGVYHRAWTMAIIPRARAVTVLGSAFLPTASRLQDDPKGLRALFVRMVSRIDLIMMPIGAGMCTGSDLLVRIALGPQWTELGPILGWMGILCLPAACAKCCDWLIVSAGASRALRNYGFLSFAIIVVEFSVASRFGIEAMTATFMLSGLLVRLPLLIWTCMRVSALNFAAVAQSFIVDILFTGVVIAAGFALRASLPPMPALAELAALSVLIAAAYMLRIALSADLRQDVRTVVRRIVSRGRR